jgi:NAD(P)-dependent dehydrogenase (short-subunit alcohol dehydrogenase family)
MTMPSLTINDADIPRLDGEVAIITGKHRPKFSLIVRATHVVFLITGGASGIGLAAVRLLAAKGAQVFVLDLTEPDANTIPSPPEGEPVLPEKAKFIRCDVTSWTDLRNAFDQAISEAGRIDIAISNAGVSEEYDYFSDQFDESGKLLEPVFGVIDVNFRAVVNFVKLAVSQMRQQRKAGDETTGRIVITSSATAYAPEHNLPVYSASKLAVSLFLPRASIERAYRIPDHRTDARSPFHSYHGRYHHQRRRTRSNNYQTAPTGPRKAAHGCRTTREFSRVCRSRSGLLCDGSAGQAR